VGVRGALSDPNDSGCPTASARPAGSVQRPALDRAGRGSLAAAPQRFPRWEAVYQQTQRWLAACCFEAMVHDLRAVLRLAEGRRADPSAVILDSHRCNWPREWASSR
jgi:transposase